MLRIILAPLAVAAACVLWAGCVESILASRGAEDLKCPRADVSVQMRFQTAVAAGCGRSVEYHRVCTRHTQTKRVAHTEPSKYERQCGYEYAYTPTYGTRPGAGSSRYRCKDVLVPGRTTYRLENVPVETCTWKRGDLRVAERRTEARGPPPSDQAPRPAPPPLASSPDRAEVDPPVTIEIAALSSPWLAEPLLASITGREVRAEHRDGTVIRARLKGLRSHSLVLDSGQIWPIEEVVRVATVRAESEPEPPR